MSSSDSPGSSDDSHEPLREVVERVAHFLPAQGPISVFIHHNTLHAFESQAFEDAVVRAGHLFQCKPFLAEETYRAELRRGRILVRDVDAVLEAELKGRGDDRIVAEVSRGELLRRILLHGIPEVRGPALQWLLRETETLACLRGDVPASARESLFCGSRVERSKVDEASLVRELWQACENAAARSLHTPPADAVDHVRHRDLVLAAHGVDIDEWIHPTLIRFTSAYLDQGLAHWAMPGRERGMLDCFFDLYGRRLARWCGAWAGGLKKTIDDDLAMKRDAWSSLRNSLSELGVHPREWESFLVEEALSLRGWAGMVRQFEERPDRVPALAIPARLVDYLAIRLLLSRAALAHAATKAGVDDAPLSELRTVLKDRLPAPYQPSVVDRAWLIFQSAQLCGLGRTAIDDLSAAEVADLETELARFDSVTKRRLLHLAFERHLRHHFYDALAQHEPQPSVPDPAFQAIFCLDEREESIRRHLEEVDPSAETFGTAGFFGIAMYFRGATDAHPRALCPVAVQPQHLVTESKVEPRGMLARWQRARRRFAALVDKNVHIGSRTFGRGAVIMAVLGVLWVVPLILKVLFPWSRRGLSHLNVALGPSSQGRLFLERDPAADTAVPHVGFTVEEMAEIVRDQLAAIGVSDRLAPLVLVLGHGSISLNNPQESAHDCGACGGGRGGPNARAFAQMANHPGVRARLAELAVRVPTETWFVGGQRNTASNDIDLFDEDLVPDRVRPRLEHAKASLERARRREARERCRRFELAPAWMSERAALMHVQTRAADLAQPRPEYGHATNAVCVVGRRSSTQGLFLDRRSFLISYDPDPDPDGAVLSRLLAATVPVVAGISLEYFFGYVDPIGYGCGTKLPHNVTGLLGVMEGAQSDLRTGLPWQMLEIHEPVRLTIAVETAPELLLRILERDDKLRRLVHNRWIFLASLDPGTRALFEIDSAGAHRYAPAHPLKVVHGTSVKHYRGHHEHLPFVRIVARDTKAGAA